jgi:hypothetical protein
MVESSRAHVHYLIAIATIEPPSRALTGAPSTFSLVPCIAPRPPRQVRTAENPQTEAILVYCKAASIRPADRGAARPPPEVVWMERHGEGTHGIDRVGEAAMAILVHRIGMAAIRP